MKIYVIGTSNSVMKNGWVFGLKQNKDMEVVNLSIGRTPCLMHLASAILHNQELKQADLIIIDHSINDINYYIPEVGNDYYEYIKDFYILISSISTPILNLMFPIYNLKYRKDGLLAIKKLIDLCKEFNIYYLDFNQLNFPYRYYEDEVHLKPEVAYFIGMELSKVLFQFSFKLDACTQIIENPYKIFTYKDMISTMRDAGFTLDIGEFKNSLGIFKFIQLDNRIDLSKFAKYHLVAIAYFNENHKTHTFEINREKDSVSYRTTDNKFFLEMINPPILIDTYSSIQKSKINIEYIPSLMERKDVIHKNITGVNISYLVFKNSENKLIWNISKKNLNLDLMPLIDKLDWKIDALFNKSLCNKDIDMIRDSAILLEDVNVDLALYLMNIAHSLRPKGIFIAKKLEEYKEKMENK